MRVFLLLLLGLSASIAGAQSNQPAAPATTTTEPAAPAAGTVNPTPVESGIPTPAAPPTTAAGPTTYPDSTPAEGVPAEPTRWGFNKGVLISPSITYYSRRLKEDASQVGEIKSLVVDGKAGYVWDFGLFAGAQVVYDMGKANDNSVSTYYAGPTIGYTCKDTRFFITATYHLIGKSDLGRPGTYDKVNGLQIDLGYPVEINKTMRFGPQISWKHLKNSDGGALADDSMTGFSPSATFWFNF